MLKIMLKINNYKLISIGLLLLLGVAACSKTPQYSGSIVLLGEPLGAASANELSGGITDLHLAIEKNKSLEDIQLLLSKGAKVNARDQYGMTPLHYAARTSKNIEVITLLLNYGANIHSLTNNRETVLHLAANHSENPAIIELFLSKGVSDKVMDNVGQKAFDYAKYNKKIRGTKAYWRLNTNKRKVRKKKS